MDVEIESVSSTSVTLTWSEPHFDKQNGHITAYDILLINSKDHLKWTVNSTAVYLSHILISPLKPFSEYNVSVAAVNVNGTGPYSQPTSFTSAQGGL